jgi:UDP-N-acetylglucosamine--N-acetylmuramyl-(pentapeptide) pyrophosphoryl-undecaprenol N-acetylglucosamine transferase
MEIVVQTGPDSSRIDWPGVRVEAMVLGELSSLMEQADVVVTHDGIGSALMAFEAGKSPVMVPRRKIHREHVDDRQMQIAQQFDDRGLVAVADVSELDLDHFAKAMSRHVKRASEPLDFQLR